jgi:hypothetical protein
MPRKASKFFQVMTLRNIFQLPPTSSFYRKLTFKKVLTGISEQTFMSSFYSTTLLFFHFPEEHHRDYSKTENYLIELSSNAISTQ